RRDARADAERLSKREVVDAAADVFAVLALQQLRDTARELDDLDSARDLALRVGKRLAVLARDEPGQRIGLALEQRVEAEQHTCALRRRRVAPRRKGFRGGAHGAIHLRGIGERDFRDQVAGRRVVYAASAPAAGFAPAADAMGRARQRAGAR